MTLEEEIFYLAENFHWTPEQVLGMSSTLRHRLIMKKADLERKRQQAHENALSRAKSKR